MIQDLIEYEVKVLALMAWADGTFDDEEKATFLNFLEGSPGSDAFKADMQRYLAEPPDEEDVLNGIKALPSVVVPEVLKLAYIIALANEHLHPREEELLERLALESGLPEDNLPQFREMLDLYRQSWEIEQELF